MDRGLGALLVVMGLGLAGVGLLAMAGGLSWVGRLPGDLRFEGARTRVLVPIASTIVLSVVLTVLVNLVLRFLR